MKRKFKVTIGEKNFIVEVEEVIDAVSVTPATKSPVRSSVEEKLPKVPVSVSTRAPTPTPGDKGVVRAPMPGVVISIKCNIKDKVTVGDLLLKLEAMKMENEIYSPKSGVVKRIAVSEQQSVNYGDVLVEID